VQRQPEPFLPRHAAAADLATWCAVFSQGQTELSGGLLQSPELAERLLAEHEPPVGRWAARRACAEPVTGVAELRPQPHEPRVGFLRLFVAPPARRNGTGSALLAQLMREASGAGLDRIQGTVLAGPPGEPFARTCRGLRIVLRLQRQDQRLDQDAVLRRCHELAVCPDPAYRLVHWRGPAPEPLAASFGRVMGHVPGRARRRAANGAPRMGCRCGACLGGITVASDIWRVAGWPRDSRRSMPLMAAKRIIASE
jgi:GNAT superfamily N-acetyltransferase